MRKTSEKYIQEQKAWLEERHADNTANSVTVRVGLEDYRNLLADAETLASLGKALPNPKITEAIETIDDQFTRLVLLLGINDTRDKEWMSGELLKIVDRLGSLPVEYVWVEAELRKLFHYERTKHQRDNKNEQG